ncbi:MAG: uroporphyrinogen decarboxylase family protein [Planctomycetaceae bacterium]
MSKERILNTIRGRAVDKAPVYHLQFSGHAASVILGRADVCIGGAHNQWLEMNALCAGPDAHAEFVARCESDAVAITKACGMDLLRLGYWRWGLKPAQKLSDDTFLFDGGQGQSFTMTYNPQTELFTRTDSGAAAGPPGTFVQPPTEEEFSRQVQAAQEQAASYAPPKGPDEKLQATIRKYPDYLVRHGGGTVYVDMHNASSLMCAALYPDLYAQLLMARAKMYAAAVPAMAMAGLEVNIAGMDFCSAQGPTISPELFRRVVSPALKKIVDACHECGMFYFYTSDGNFWPLADEMFDVIGVDGWMETDASAGMDLRRLRQRYPRVTFQGTIRVQVLHRGSIRDVKRETMECLAVAHDCGGVIVGASNLIMPGTPPENILAMLRTIEDNR